MTTQRLATLSKHTIFWKFNYTMTFTRHFDNSRQTTCFR